MAQWVVAVSCGCAVTGSSPADCTLRRPPGLSEMASDSLSGGLRGRLRSRWSDQMGMSMTSQSPMAVGCGDKSLTSEMTDLHYITHTEDSRKPLTPSESAANTCETARSRLDARRSAAFRPRPERAPNARESPPISQLPHARCCAAGPQAEEGRARVRSGATGGAGDARPRPENATLFPTPIPKSSPASKGGPPAPLSGQRGPT